MPIAIGQAENDGAALHPRLVRARAARARAEAVPRRLRRPLDRWPRRSLAGLLVVAGAYLLAARADARERRAVAPLAILAATVVAIPALLALTGADYLITRNVIVALPLALIVLAAGYGATRAGAPGIAAGGRPRGRRRGALRRSGRRRPLPARRLARGRPPARPLRRPPHDSWSAPSTAAIPLELYLPQGAQGAGGGARPVTEIDVVGVTPRGPGDSADPPRYPSPPPAARLRRRAPHRGRHLHGGHLPLGRAARLPGRPALRRRPGGRSRRADGAGPAARQLASPGGLGHTRVRSRSRVARGRPARCRLRRARCLARAARRGADGRGGDARLARTRHRGRRQADRLVRRRPLGPAGHDRALRRAARATSSTSTC